MRTLQSRVSILGETLNEERGPEVEPDEPEKGFRTFGFVTGLFLLGAVGLLVYGVTAGNVAVTLGGLLLAMVAITLSYFFWERRSAALTIRRANETR